jgi:hypothetical protein
MLCQHRLYARQREREASAELPRTALASGLAAENA